MKVPFTSEQFFEIFEKYNSAMYPSQIILLVLALLGIFLLYSKNPIKDKFIGLFLGLLWIWTGLMYHITFFTQINKLAFVFGGLFIIQGILILISSLFTRQLVFSYHHQTKDYFGYFFIGFGLIVYPLISYFTLGEITKTISLGLPCPTTIFTFGFLILTSSQFPKYLLIIPSLWALVGLSAAINFGVYQDYMIIVAAITANYFLLKRR